MIANVIHFYNGGISVSDAKKMSFHELLRFYNLGVDIKEEEERQAKAK